MVVYEDFLCPYCGQFEKAGRSQFTRDIAADKVRFEYHVLNFLTSSAATDYSLRSANAVAVVLDASGPSVAKKFHDLLYEHQPADVSAGLSDAQLVDDAVQAGAPRVKVAAGIAHRTFEPWVKHGTSQASRGGVTATPTVKIGGTVLSGASTSALAAAVQRAIDRG